MFDSQAVFIPRSASGFFIPDMGIIPKNGIVGLMDRHIADISTEIKK
jgi:hypothetical protein